MKERVEELERAINELATTIEGMRRWIIWLSIAVGLVGLSFAFRTASESVQERLGIKVVSANAFRVVRGGKTVALVYANDDGGAIMVFNRKGEAVAELSSAKGNGWLQICDTDGTTMVAVYANDVTASGAIQVFRRKGQSYEDVVGIGYHPQGFGWLYLTDALGRMVWTAP